MTTDDRWTLIETATPQLLDRLGPDGVTAIRYTAAFPDDDDLAVWLCTSTDTERDRLDTDNPRLDVVREVLAAVGLTNDRLGVLATVAQSQETVDRDYRGNWFYALR
ncbi:MAG: hypothetical protein L0Z47_04790 [Actinobacteria bacterium]|nr:hypothetical protein [Actinomycetota bacterium]